MDYKQSVLTYIFGSYEILHEVQQVDDDTEYICVTDNHELTSDTWTIEYYDGNDGDNAFDKVCYVRYHPFEFVHTDTVIKIDGSIIIKGSVHDIMESFEGHDICIMIHPDRMSFEEELTVWTMYRGYTENQKENCMEYLRSIDADNIDGLYQLCFQIQRNSVPNNEINDLTYKAIQECGSDGHVERVDQVIFSALMNKYFGGKFSVMFVLEWLVTKGRTFSWCHHGTNEPIEAKEYQIHPYLFGSQI